MHGELIEKESERKEKKNKNMKNGEHFVSYLVIKGKRWNYLKSKGKGWKWKHFKYKYWSGINQRVQKLVYCTIYH